MRASSDSTEGRPLLIPPHDRFSSADVEQVTGKAANLGELLRAGFPVPPGFIVTTVAYDQFVSHNDLAKTISQVVDQGHGSGVAIRGAFESAPIPREVEQAILTAHGQLGPDPVAVRSSATAEDLPEA